MAIVPPSRPNIPANWPDSLDNVGRLPREIIGDFSGLKSFGGAFRLTVAGSLPSPITGNFNNIVPGLPVPYGSVGFTLICRSTSDFTRILAVVYDYLSMGYSDELSAAGAGSVTLDMDDDLLAAQLVNGTTLEELLEADNLWEVYFDGERRFQWLGQNVKEVFIGSEETRGISISGPGIAASLAWARILPNRFPAPKEKIDTIRDDFTNQDVDIYGKWSDNAGTVQAANKRAGITVTAAGGLGSYIGTAVNYDFVDSGAQARVQPYIPPAGAGRVRTYMSIETDTANYAMIYSDRDTNDLVGDNLIAETRGPGGVFTTRITYNSTSQAYWRIQELDGDAIFSYRSVTSTEADWVVFATLPYSFNPTSVRLRLRADAIAGTNLTLPETSYFSEVSTAGVASPIPLLEEYRRLLQRAQERGTCKHIIPNWTAQADSMGVPWIGNPTVETDLGSDLLSVLSAFCEAQQADWFMDSDFRLHVRQRVWTDTGNAGPTFDTVSNFETDVSNWYSVAGEGSIARSTAQSYLGAASLLLTPDGVGVQAAARSNPTAGVSPGDKLIASARMRCTTARTVRLRIDWRDSAGTFLSTQGVNIDVSANTWTYFEITGDAPANAAQAGITAMMTGTPPASHLLYVDEARLRTADLIGPTVPYHKEKSVIFYEGDSQQSKERSRAYASVRNYLVNMTETGEYVVSTSPTSVAKYQQREDFVSSSLSARDVPSLQTTLANQLVVAQEGIVSWTLTVPYDIKGKRLYEDYVLGDWIGVQTAFPFRTDTWRIAALSLQIGADGDPEVELTLHDKMTPYWHKLKDDVNRLKWRVFTATARATRR